jgi:hypothetical protein
MKTNTLLSILAVAAFASFAACGDNLKLPADGHMVDSAPTPDGFCSNCPAVPTLGAQIDRMGRPAVNTALNHGFDKTSAAGPAKTAYNQDGAVGMWPTTYRAAFMVNLGIIDVLDTGLTCMNGTCMPETTPTISDGCGNQVLYNGQPYGGGTAAAASYSTLATILADDQLYLDTSKKVCDIPNSHQNYLAVEFNVVTGIPNQVCGGRAPTNDVIDTSYSVLAVGINGFNATDGMFTAAVQDGAGPHADVSITDFPFLGPPHTP